ncbi:hypothetical protein AB0L34_21875 [Micromonospora sp. NPDC052213]|uniref:hypothetical protein n=1 Tax=Micromonospora sp. NPDC052213 TaxID=3155812 RepID=UPI0034133E0D
MTGDDDAPTTSLIEEDPPRQRKTGVAAVDDAGLRIDLNQDAVAMAPGIGAWVKPGPCAWSDPRSH